MKNKKITFIYAYENEEWSTPISLAKEFESRDWEVDYVSIGSNRTGNYHDTELQLWIQQDLECDIALFMDWGRFDSKWLDKSLKPKTFWIQESGDDPQNYNNNCSKAIKFNMTFTPDSDSNEKYIKDGINSHWINHFADTRVHFNISTKPKYIAVTSRGEGGSNFLDILTTHGKGTIGNKNKMGPKEHTEFLNNGLMVVQNSRHGEITRRIFEGMLCGKMVLTDRLKDSKKLHELFEDQKSIVFYDNIIDCINKMNYYTEHDSARQMIAIKGWELVINNHTQVQRVDFLIEKYNEWKNLNS